MKIVIDIPEGLLERIRGAVEAGGFRSVGQFAMLALENQLSLETSASVPAGNLAPGASTARELYVQHGPSAESDQLPGLKLARPVSAPTVESSPAARLAVEERGWLWGIVNRIFPVKVALRSLATDCAERPHDLGSARIRAGERAERVSKWLLRAYAGEGPSRDESLLTGLPTREPLYKATERFVDHFFGRVDKSGAPWGALFELGLAGVVTSETRTLVGLTAAGGTLAELENPVLDEGRLDRPLSSEETKCYLELVATQVPREASCYKVILAALLEREMTVHQMDELARRSLPNRFSDAAVQTMKAGALGRMQDLELLTRVKAGKSARFAITQRGEAALDLFSGEAAQRTAQPAPGGPTA